MKLLTPDADLTGIDCHIHSTFSPDAKHVGADEPEIIADAVRKKGLRGFIVTDHVDIGHWGGHIIDFDKYFATWERVRQNNTDLAIYIGIEVGFERATFMETARVLGDLPFEYVINSVHYWEPCEHGAEWRAGKAAVYKDYLNAVRESLDVPYPFTTVGHLGFPERYAPYPADERAMEYSVFREIMDDIIKTAVARGIRFEENTNSDGGLKLPREGFLRALKLAGGTRPVLGSDAHTSDKIGHAFDETSKLLDKIF